MNTLIRLRPNSIVLGLMGRVNYAWAQLDLISTAAFASLLNLDPVELGMAIGRIETQAKIEKMREISRHRGADELSAFFANIKSQLKRLRPDRNAVTHGAYMGKTHKGELCFRLPAAFIVAEGEQTTQRMFVFTVPQLKQHIADVTKIAISLLNKFDYQEMRKLLDLPARVPRQTE